MDERRILAPDAPGVLLAQRPQTVAGGGRLGVYATFGACAGALPLPWVPDAMARSIRGALVHDIAVRHGVSLSPEARTVLAEPLAPGARRGWLVQATRFFGSRLAARTVAGFLPLGFLWPVHGAVRTYVLGRLFDRYLEQSRAERSVVLDAEEARRVRRAIEGALLHAVTRPMEPADRPPVVHDERGLTTAFVDGLLGLAASVPDRLTRRVDIAFDERLSHGRS
jgi:hypothetical protein